MMEGYLVPAGPGEAEFVEKRSRFLGHIRHIESEEEARAFIAQVKKEHFDARHNCWCYLLKDGPERYSDDGEPQGTAGIPMLEVFRREQVTDLVCVVTRYFGGVLLGAGGLLRAYTKSAKDALDEAGIAALRPWSATLIPCAYNQVQRLRQELEALGGKVQNIDYGAEVTIEALVPQEVFPQLKDRIFDTSRGSIVLEELDQCFQAVRIR